MSLGLVAATGATAGSTAAIAGTATVAVVALVAHAFEEALESAEAAFVQMTAVLAAVGTTGVVAVAIAGIGARRVAFPIAVIEFAAAATLVDFAAELRGTGHFVADMTPQPATMTAARVAIAATVITTPAAGVATAGIAATAANQTINQPRFAMTAMTTPISENEKTADDGQTSKLVCEHGELPPGNLKRRNRWKRLRLAGSNRVAAKGQIDQANVPL